MGNSKISKLSGPPSINNHIQEIPNESKSESRNSLIDASSKYLFEIFSSPKTQRGPEKIMSSIEIS